MLKETISYVDYNGTNRTEDYYFNLNKAEIIELESSESGGLSAMLEDVVKSNNSKTIISIFKKIILKAYGKKSEDGKRFIKNASLREEFEQSEAYSELFMKLATNAEAAAAFVNGIIPKDVAALANNQLGSGMSSAS